MNKKEVVPARKVPRVFLVFALAVASALVLVLTGCAAPATAPPAALRAPADLGLADSVASSPVAAAWWTQFGDPVLDGLVDRALAGAPSLRIAAARAAAAQALADAAAGAARPHLNFETDAMRQRVSETGLYPPPLAGSTFNTGNLQLIGGWSPDLFGRQRAELDAALGTARAAQADAAFAGHRLALQVVQGYVDLARLQGLREVAVRTLAQREELLGLVRRRVDAGLDTSIELRQGEGALPEARVQIESLDERIALARHQLAVLTAQAPSALDGLAPRLDGLRSTAQPTVLGADLLGRRADVAAARARVEAATRQVAVARTRFYPDVNLNAFIGLNAIGLDHFFDLGNRVYGAGPALTLPLFDGGQLRAGLNARAADLDAAIESYNQQVLGAVREAVDASASVASVARQRAEQATALADAESAYRIAQARYRQGLTNYLVVLNAESQWLAQRRQQVELQFRTVDAQAQLMTSLGGGWDGGPSSAVSVSASAPY